ncbi:MAG: cytochrome b/b6 domain-containing protein [Mariprofundaceae bacterium]
MMKTAIPGTMRAIKLVWDPLVRSFHWLVAASFAMAYFLAGDWFYLHLAAGYGILLLVSIRIVWGFLGSRHARFADFSFPLSDVLRHLRNVAHLRPERHTGHNPAGGIMIFWLLASLLLLAISGMSLYAVEDGAGPLAPWLSDVDESWEAFLTQIHDLLVNLVILSVFAHVAGVLIESILLRENLVTSMITGRKTIAHNHSPTGDTHEK